MFNIGTGELALILVVALLVLGPTKLPELARGIGKALREFRRQTDEVRGVVEREFYRMDQELDEGLPKVLVPPDAVAQVPPHASPELVQPGTSGPPAALPAPVDESDPGHPDYHRADPPPEPPAAPEPAAGAAPVAPPEPKA